MSFLERNGDVPNLTASVVALGLVSILGFITYALVFYAIPKDNQTALNLLIGILSTNIGLIVGYFFGSSIANKKLQEINATQASAIQATAVQAAVQTATSGGGITGTDNPPGVVTTTTTKITGDTT